MDKFIIKHKRQNVHISEASSNVNDTRSHESVLASIESNSRESSDTCASQPPAKRKRCDSSYSIDPMPDLDNILTLKNPDIGYYSLDQLRSSRDSVKYHLLQHHFRPPTASWKAPQHLCGTFLRRVNKSFLNGEYPTITYSPYKDGIYCVDCVLFRTDEIQLTGSPITDWSNAIKYVKCHIKTADHLKASQRAQEFSSVFTSKSKSVLQLQSKANTETLERNNKALASIIECILYLSRQGLAIRGQ